MVKNSHKRNITVYPFIYERVNRYTVNSVVMLTASQGMVRCSWIEKAVVDADWSLERKGGIDGGGRGRGVIGSSGNEAGSSGRG